MTNREIQREKKKRKFICCDINVCVKCQSILLVLQMFVTWTSRLYSYRLGIAVSHRLSVQRSTTVIFVSKIVKLVT